MISGFCFSTERSGLVDLGMMGYAFTWERSRGTSNWIEERLDKAMATQPCMLRFPRSVVYSIEVPTYDHLPIFF